MGTFSSKLRMCLADARRCSTSLSVHLCRLSPDKTHRLVDFLSSIASNASSLAPSHTCIAAGEFEAQIAHDVGQSRPNTTEHLSHNAIYELRHASISLVSPRKMKCKSQRFLSRAGVSSSSQTEPWSKRRMIILSTFYKLLHAGLHYNSIQLFAISTIQFSLFRRLLLIVQEWPRTQPPQLPAVRRLQAAQRLSWSVPLPLVPDRLWLHPLLRRLEWLPRPCYYRWRAFDWMRVWT